MLPRGTCFRSQVRRVFSREVVHVAAWAGITLLVVAWHPKCACPGMGRGLSACRVWHGPPSLPQWG